MNTLKIDQEELRSLVREAVQKKLASMKGGKGKRPPTLQRETAYKTANGSILGASSASKVDDMQHGRVSGWDGGKHVYIDLADTAPDTPEGLLKWVEERSKDETKALQQVQKHQGDAATVKVMRRMDRQHFEGYSDETLLNAVRHLDFENFEVVRESAQSKMTGVPMESRKPSTVNTQEADELQLYIENEIAIWESNQKKSIEKNLARKMKKGNYDSQLAAKLWNYLVDAAAAKYMKDYSDVGMRANLFNKATRMEVAQRLAQEFEQAVKSGEKNLDDLIAAI